MQLLLSILAGVLLADFLSGVIHWIQDRYAKPSWPLVGAAVTDAHDHHAKPHKFLERSFLRRNSAVGVIVLIIGLLVALCGGLNTMTVTALIVGALSNEIHGFTHRRHVSGWVEILQYFGLIQTQDHHRRHHYGDEGGAYCVITAWLNPALDHLHIWQIMEAAIMATTGIRPDYERTKKPKSTAKKEA